MFSILFFTNRLIILLPPIGLRRLSRGCSVKVKIPGVSPGIFMIKFDRLWITMEQKKFTTYMLREQCGIDSKTVRRLKANDNMETKTLNKLCAVLQCKLEDIAEFIPDE